jgi:ATP-dependent Clp protease ATP-binding subunit ClpC
MYEEKSRLSKVHVSQKKKPAIIDSDVMVLASYYSQIFESMQDKLDIESFYHLIANLQRYNKYKEIYNIPYNFTRGNTTNIREFLKSPVSHEYITTILQTERNATDIKNHPINLNMFSKSVYFSSPLEILNVSDLTYWAFEGKCSTLIGREYELGRLIDILSKSGRCNAVLLGNPGVGKTAIVEALAQKIVEFNVPDSLKFHRILQLNLSSTIAGCKYRGDFEEKVKEIFDDLEKANQPIILYIDEIHCSVGLGDAHGDSISFSEMLKTLAVTSDVKIIGTSTFKDFMRFESDKGLERRFETITVEEPTFEETMNILQHFKEKYEEYYHIKIHSSSLEAVINLSKQYIPEHYLPDKAIDVLDESCAIKVNSSERKNDIIELLPDDVLLCISRKKNIPINKIQKSYNLEDLEKYLSKRVIGQPHVIKTVARAIRRAQAGLNDETKPLASFMFIGPTGVGKTEIAKALAEIMFAERDSFIRIDMSEYMEEHSVSKLIGSPPGYVGFENAGFLTEQVRHHPYSLILFDEFEKAHPKISNILLQILDDGILTDSHGETINFKNTIIILTSNIGVRELTRSTAGFCTDNSNQSANVMQEVKKSFSPEFLNRLDEIIQFNQLTPQNIHDITKLCIDTEIVKKLEAKGISITISDDVINKIAQQGYSEEYGARELKRTITRELKNALADFLLKNLHKKAARICVSLQNKTITVSETELIGV